MQDKMTAEIDKEKEQISLNFAESERDSFDP